MNVALQIRDVPDGVRDALARQAAAAGLSLQKYLLNLVVREAGQVRNVQLLRDVRPAGDLSADEAVGRLATARADRAQQIEEAIE